MEWLLFLHINLEEESSRIVPSHIGIWYKVPHANYPIPIDVRIVTSFEGAFDENVWCLKYFISLHMLNYF